MSRSLPEWIGATDDQVPPPKVRLRVLLAHNSECCECGRPIGSKRWICDHRKALINGGENRETNLGPIHEACDKTKTAADMAEKSMVYRKRLKNYGIKGPRKGFYDKSKFKARIGGGLVDRRTGQPATFKSGVRHDRSNDRT